MTGPTIAQICNAIETTLGAATGLTYAHTYSELREGMQDVPLLQVYPDSARQDPSGSADRTSFQAGVRQTDHVIFCDLYAKQRHEIGEDMAALVPLIDAIIAVLEAQNTKNYFGLDRLQAYAWSWQRVIFVYGDPALPYIGARFTLNVRTF